MRSLAGSGLIGSLPEVRKDILIVTQITFTSSKSTMETLVSLTSFWCFYC